MFPPFVVMMLFMNDIEIPATAPNTINRIGETLKKREEQNTSSMIIRPM